jgi:hypothetical protein
MAALVLLIWLIRGPLGIGSDSLYLLEAAFGFVLLGRIFDTKTNAGTGRAVSSFLWNLTATAIIVIILIWFLGWVASLQGAGNEFPMALSNYAPDIVVAAIATGLGAYAANKLSPRRKRLSPAGPLFLVKGGADNSVGRAGLAPKHDSVGIPIKRAGRSVGCVVVGDLSASFETPMGIVSATLPGPVTTWWVPFHGGKLSDGDVTKMTGKSTKQLIQEARVDTTPPGNFGRFDEIDLPFVHIRNDGLGGSVEVGPVKVHRDTEGGHVSFGPFDIDSDSYESDDHRWSRWEKKQRWRERHGWQGNWMARGTGDTYLQSDGWRTSAKWNGSVLDLEGGSMKLSIGSDSFSYSPNEIKTSSPLHTLQVTQDKITLNASKFTLNVMGNSVILRTEDKTRTTDSKPLADDLRTLLSETAKKQVKDVMEGLPIDLNEMLSATEEVLTRHG